MPPIVPVILHLTDLHFDWEVRDPNARNLRNTSQQTLLNTIDRTLYYLASGKPVVVQQALAASCPTQQACSTLTPSPKLHCLKQMLADYDQQGVLARQLAEEYFDALRVTAALLAQAL